MKKINSIFLMKNINKSLTVQNFFNKQIHTNFNSEESLFN